MVFEPEELLENGDQIVALVTRRARPKGSGGEMVVRNGHIWTLRDPEKALEAAGLSD
jgi:hypothetical protein